MSHVTSGLRNELDRSLGQFSCDKPQGERGAKNSRPFIVICPALTFFVKKVGYLKNNF